MSVLSVTHNYLWVVLTLPLSCCRTVSTTVDPYRDISLDLAPNLVTNRTSTPIDINGEFESKCSG